MVLYEYSNSRKRNPKEIRNELYLIWQVFGVEIILINTYSFGSFPFKVSLESGFDGEKVGRIFDQHSEIQGKLVLFLVENLVYSVYHVDRLLFYGFHAHNP
jgi:hypothetical protein